MIDVIKPGLETGVQDFPGRYGFWEQGFPPSGPFDMWSFRLANLLVGNAAEAAGLEIQFLGPTLRFEGDTVIALTGATMAPTLDGAPMPQWESVAVPAGAVLETGFARTGARAYLTVAGHVTKTGKRRKARIVRRTTRLAGHAVSQRLRERIAERFGRIETTGGLPRTRHRGLDRAAWMFTLTTAAYNLVRLPKPMAEAAI